MKGKYVTFDKSACSRGMIYCNCHDRDETDEDIARAINSGVYIERFNKDEYICAAGEEIKNDSRIHVIYKNNASYLVQIGSSVWDMENRTIPHTYYVRFIGMLV